MRKPENNVYMKLKGMQKFNASKYTTTAVFNLIIYSKLTELYVISSITEMKCKNDSTMNPWSIISICKLCIK